MSHQRREALQLLFGTEVGQALAAGASDWVSRLRSAYRRRAHETHPDRAAVLGRAPDEMVGEFQRVKEAYELLRALPWAPPAGPVVTPPPWASPPPPSSSGAKDHRAPSDRAAGDRGSTDRRSTDRSSNTRSSNARATDERTRDARSSNDRAAGAPPPPADRAAREASSARDFSTYDRRGRATAGERQGPADPPRPGEPPAPRFHRGSVPQRELRFAEFLFFSGRIPWQTLIEAVCWQRRQQPLLGRLAVRLGFLTSDQVSRILDERERAGASRQLFGQFALEHGHLTRFQVLVLLGLQQREGRRIGQYFVERGLFDEHELQRLLAEQAAHARSLRRRAT